jgi:hypothetical protein
VTHDSQVVRDTLLQVNISVSNIEEAISSASELVQSVTLDAETFCPGIDNNEFEARIGIDLNELINSITKDYDSMMGTSQENIDFVHGLLQSLEEGLVSFENFVAGTEDLLWMIPAVLFAVSIFTALAVLGVLLAWREKSGKKVQNTMAYVVLPLLMAATIACWFIVIFSSLGTMVGSDVCTASTSKGSPDETIQQILDILNLDRNSTAFKVAQAYTNVSLFSLFQKFMFMYQNTQIVLSIAHSAVLDLAQLKTLKGSSRLYRIISMRFGGRFQGSILSGAHR